jgi:hypothetical protein
MPIAHPYVTSTVYLNSNPLAKYNNHDIIKSKSDKVYCSYNRKNMIMIFICIMMKKEQDGLKQLIA